MQPGKRAMNVAHLLTEAAKDRPHHTAAPRLVEFVAAIPQSASGKAPRRLLRSQGWA